MEWEEPASFWLGPRAADLIHLGAKFAPCMRRDARIARAIAASARRERDTACCIRNDDSGCVQSSKADCSVSITLLLKVLLHYWRLVVNTANLFLSMAKRNSFLHSWLHSLHLPACLLLSSFPSLFIGAWLKQSVSIMSEHVTTICNFALLPNQLAWGVNALSIV